MDWIDIRDKIPEKDGYYLVYQSSGAFGSDVQIDWWSQNR